jgi:hypothetical protein
MGGWASTQMLLDTDSHFLPREIRGFSNALNAADRTRPNQANNAEQKTSFRDPGLWAQGGLREASRRVGQAP